MVSNSKLTFFLIHKAKETLQKELQGSTVTYFLCQAYPIQLGLYMPAYLPDTLSFFTHLNPKNIMLHYDYRTLDFTSFLILASQLSHTSEKRFMQWLPEI